MTQKVIERTLNRKRSVQEKLIDVQDAMALINDGARIVTAMAAAEPQAFFKNIATRAAALQGIHVTCANPLGDYPCFSQELIEHIEFNVLFLTHHVRKRQLAGNISYVPQHLSRWSENLLRSGTVNIFWGTCSTPDERGFISLGAGACYEPEMLRAADLVILEMNKNVPVTYGATIFHTDNVDYFIENDVSLPELKKANVSDIDRQIGAHVAELVEDGSTIQLGIGGIPNAITDALKGKNELGVHTEMINDSIMELAEQGIVTGQRKTIWPNRIVGAFVYGSKSLYDFVDHNPMVELQPASVVNDPYRIGRNHKMVSINTAVEVDITGQVCSESLGHLELSGVGGASDTHNGAQRSQYGRGVVALNSTTKDRTSSKIVFELKPGAKVSISRNDIDTVVTEFGIAELRGKSVHDRVAALINIAHPDFRGELREKALHVGYLNKQ